MVESETRNIILKEDENIKLTEAGYDDMIFVFDLRNDIEVTRSGFNTDPVELGTYRKRFERRLRSEYSTILIGEKKTITRRAR